MIRSLSGASNRVTVARINGIVLADPQVFDDSKVDDGRNPEHWKRTAHRENSLWIVTTEYVGPPASIGAPGVYELAIDADDRLTDVIWLLSFLPEPR